MIPFELLRIITSHLVQASPCSPVIFELPPSFFLDRVTAEPSQLSSEIVARGFPVSSSPAGSRSVAASPCSPTHSLARPVKLAHLLWTNPTIRRALHTATGGGIPVSHTKRSRPKSIVSSELSGSIILTLPDPLPKNIVVEHPYVRNGSSSPCVDYEKSVDGDPPRPQSAPPAVDKTAKFSVVRTLYVSLLDHIWKCTSCSPLFKHDSSVRHGGLSICSLVKDASDYVGRKNKIVSTSSSSSNISFGHSREPVSIILSGKEGCA